MNNNTKSDLNLPNCKDTKQNDIFSNRQVKGRKDIVLKTKIDTLIANAGLSHREFYRLVCISRQQFYAISWGIEKPTVALRLKIARVLKTDSFLIWPDSSNIALELIKDVWSEKEGEA